jgi:hypothetical protein
MQRSIRGQYGCEIVPSLSARGVKAVGAIVCVGRNREAIRAADGMSIVVLKSPQYRASGEDRELVTAVPLSRRGRLVTQALGKPDAFDHLCRGGTTGERNPEPCHDLPTPRCFDASRSDIRTDKTSIGIKQRARPGAAVHVGGMRRWYPRGVRARPATHIAASPRYIGGILRSSSKLAERRCHQSLGEHGRWTSFGPELPLMAVTSRGCLGRWRGRLQIRATLSQGGPARPAAGDMPMVPVVNSYRSSHTSSKRQPLKTLLRTIVSPLTRGCQQVATRV